MRRRSKLLNSQYVLITWCCSVVCFTTCSGNASDSSQGLSHRGRWCCSWDLSRGVSVNDLWRKSFKWGIWEWILFFAICIIEIHVTLIILCIFKVANLCYFWFWSLDWTLLINSDSVKCTSHFSRWNKASFFSNLVLYWRAGKVFIISFS